MEIRFEDRVTLTIADGVATLALDRPKALNALDDAMATAIGAAAARCEADPAVRAVIVTGGEHFMAGGDLRSFAQRLGTGEGSVAALAAMIDEIGGVDQGEGFKRTQALMSLELEDSRERSEELKAQISRLEKALQKSEQWLHFSSELFRDALNTSLQLTGSSVCLRPGGS